MKTSLLASIATSAFVLVASQASAADVGGPAPGPSYAPYVSLFAGASFPQDIMTTRGSGASHYNQVNNSGYLVGGAIGMNWNGWARTEIELSHSNWGGSHFGEPGAPSSGSPANVDATYLMGNVWLDWKTGSAFTPYIGGGLGVAFVSFDEQVTGIGHGFTGNNSVFAYQLGAGVNFAISDQLSLDVGYRYKATSDFNILDGDGNADPFHNGHLASHNVQIGLTYQF